MRNLITLQTVIEQLDTSGVLSAAEIECFCSSQSAVPASGDALARALVQAHRITNLQAKLVCAGQSRHLRLGSYVILRKIGRGGMGSVYQAKHTRMDRVVAIKVVSPRLLKSAEAKDQFDQETRTAARLNHPNIVTAYDAGIEGALRYLVMEYVDGSDLGSRVDRQGPLSISLASRFLRQAALGLKHAHDKGVIHRDVKPGNLLVGSDGVVKLSDLGMARLLGEQCMREKANSRGVVILGTLDFLAPEQAMRFAEADERSDVYGLGCALYYLLVGKCIYPGESPTDKLLAHREQPIPSLRNACPEASAELERVFQRMVAKRPSDRFQSMEGVLAALDGLSQAGGSRPQPGSDASSNESDDESDDELREFLVGIEKSGFNDAGYETHRLDTRATERTVVRPARKRPSRRRGQRYPVRTAGLVLITLVLGILFAATSFKANHRRGNTAEPDKLPKPNVGVILAGNDRLATPNPQNYGLYFNGESAYASAPTLKFDGRPPLTVEAHVWVQPSRSEFVQVIAGWGDVAVLTVSGSGHVYGLSTFYPDGRAASIYSEQAATRVHVAGVWDGQYLSLYLNGKRQETAVVHSIRDSAHAGGPANFSMGGWCRNIADTAVSDGPRVDACSHFGGILDEIRVSRAVRYQANFRPASRFRCDADTLALYHADEGEGDVLRDSSGNQHHAQIHGARWKPIPSGHQLTSP